MTIICGMGVHSMGGTHSMGRSRKQHAWVFQQPAPCSGPHAPCRIPSCAMHGVLGTRTLHKATPMRCAGPHVRNPTPMHVAGAHAHAQAHHVAAGRRASENAVPPCVRRVRRGASLQVDQHELGRPVVRHEACAQAGAHGPQHLHNRKQQPKRVPVRRVAPSAGAAVDACCRHSSAWHARRQPHAADQAKPKPCNRHRRCPPPRLARGRLRRCGTGVSAWQAAERGRATMTQTPPGRRGYRAPPLRCRPKGVGGRCSGAGCFGARGFMCAGACSCAIADSGAARLTKLQGSRCNAAQLTCAQSRMHSSPRRQPRVELAA